MQFYKMFINLSITFHSPVCVHIKLDLVEYLFGSRSQECAKIIVLLIFMKNYESFPYYMFRSTQNFDLDGLSSESSDYLQVYN